MRRLILIRNVLTTSEQVSDLPGRAWFMRCGSSKFACSRGTLILLVHVTHILRVLLGIIHILCFRSDLGGRARTRARTRARARHGTQLENRAR